MYTNLLDETVEKLARCGKTPDDVKWVVDNKEFCTWEIFAPYAAGYNYDNGYGAVEVNESLCIVGEDWWLERHEYDGAEAWAFKTIPTIDNKYLTSQIKLTPEVFD